MVWEIIFWASLIYISGFILTKISLSCDMFKEGYKVSGVWQALRMGFTGFFMKVRGFAKLRLILSFIALLFSSYYGNNFLGISKPYFESDVKNLIYYFDSYEINNTPEYNKELVELSKKINQYSTKGINRLKNFSKIYISYVYYTQNDFIDCLGLYSPETELKYQVSIETKKKMNDLLKYDIREKMDLEQSTMLKLVDKINMGLLQHNLNERIPIIENAKETAVENQYVSKNLMESVYKIIFKEKLQ